MIRACIFDLGGTIVDKYSLSPFRSFKQAFKNILNKNYNFLDKDTLFSSFFKNALEIRSINDGSMINKDDIIKICHHLSNE